MSLPSWTVVAVVCVFMAQASASFYGICYSPYASMGVCRSLAEVEEDARLMLEHTSRIRLYSTECPDVMHTLLKKASRGELSLLLGVWMDHSNRDHQELETLLKYLEQYPHASLDGIVIGNEVMLRGQAGSGYMAYFVNDARNRVGPVLTLAAGKFCVQVRELGHAVHSQVLKTVPVFSVEAFPDAGVVAASDAVGVNIHPFYDFTLHDTADPHDMAVAAVERFKMKLDQMRQQFPGQRIIVTEVGWPSSSDVYAGDGHEGSDQLQLHFVKEFLTFTQQDAVEYYFFEFKNADWKRFGQNYRSGAYSEFNFGLFDAAGNPKLALQG